MTQAGNPLPDSEKKENGGDKETVTIPLQEYERLRDISILMDCLIDAGVDNWEGYDDAVSDYYDIKGVDELTNDEN